MAPMNLSTDTRNKLIDIGNRFVVAKEKSERIGWTENLGLVDENCYI